MVIGGKQASMNWFRPGSWTFGGAQGVTRGGGRTDPQRARQTSYERETAGRACQRSFPWALLHGVLALATGWCMVGSHMNVLGRSAPLICVLIFLANDSHSQRRTLLQPGKVASTWYLYLPARLGGIIPRQAKRFLSNPVHTCWWFLQGTWESPMWKTNANSEYKTIHETFQTIAPRLISNYFAAKSTPCAWTLARYILSSLKIRRPDFVNIISWVVLFKKNFPMRVPSEFQTCTPSPHPE